jgi:hypothetical protein
MYGSDRMRVDADTDLLDWVCENEKDFARLRGKRSDAPYYSKSVACASDVRTGFGALELHAVSGCDDDDLHLRLQRRSVDGLPDWVPSVGRHLSASKS